MRKNDEISELLYTRLRLTASLYRLPKIHKQRIPLHSALPLPDSSYEHLDKTLAEYFEKCERVDMETIT